MTEDSGEQHPPKGGEPGPSPVLPEPVRRRVASATADVIRGWRPNEVPAGLRMATRWRPGAMPRGFAERIIDGLAADGDFRQRVATALVEQDQTAQAVVAGTADPASDPALVGAVLYLARPADWQARLEAVVSALAAGVDVAAQLREAQSQVADLRARLARAEQGHQQQLTAAVSVADAARAQLAAAVDRLREQLATAKQERDEARAACDEYRREAGELDRAVRRLKAQLEQAAAATGQQRSGQREARLAATARAKVLLDVLGEAAAALAGELALPAGTPAPADLVRADAPSDPVASKRLHTTGELSTMLTMPRAHLIVDGYNVSQGMWPGAALAPQRDRLIAALTALQSRTGAEITVVFDGAEVGSVPAATSRAVRVRFSPAGELADRVIVRIVDADTTGRPLVVASSDAALTSGARGAGARTVEAQVLAAMLRPAR